MENKYKVYMHTFPNNKIYIGITQMKLSKRFLNGKGYKSNIYMTRAIQKYGWENVKHEVLYDNLTKEEAEQKEIELIKNYKATNSQFGYNIENGGNTIGKLSSKTKKKLSLLNKGKLLGNKNGMYGKHHTKQAKEKIRIAHLGKEPWNKGLKNCFSEQTKLKMKEHFKDLEKETRRIEKMKKTKIERNQMYATDEERHKARLMSMKKYKEKHKEEIKEYNKIYRLNHKNNGQ